MNDSIQSNPINKFSPNNWKLWLLLAFLFKGLIFIAPYLKNGFPDITSLIGYTSPDTESYLVPMENLVDNGEYSPDYRMPGYGIFYLPFYSLFGEVTAMNLLILLQYISNSISVYILALISLSCFKNKKIFYITFFLYAISTYEALFTKAILTESFSCSFVIFATYLVIRWHESKKLNNLFFAGLFLTTAVFQRPIFLPIFGLYGLFILVQSGLLKRTIKPVFILLLPFLLADGAWIARNALVYERVIPLTKTVFYPKLNNSIFLPASEFVKSWGGDFVFWEPNAEIRWFGLSYMIGQEPGMEMSIPEKVFTSEFGLVEMNELRDDIHKFYLDSTLSEVQKQQIIDLSTERFNRYTASVKKEHLFIYYVEAPLKVLKKFIIHSGTYNLFSKPSNELSYLELAIKIAYSLMYLAMIGLGFLGALLLLKKSVRLTPIALPVGILLYITLVHGLVLRFSEFRYFVPAWPFLIICASYTIYLIQQKIISKKMKTK